MKVVILAGGRGTRLSEETSVRPKPMAEIGEKPILWHIMKIYSHFGFNDFVILLGYKGYYIKEYFANYLIHQSNITIDLKQNKTTIIDSNAEPWSITLLETGLNTMTGGRILRAKPYLKNEPFMLTYGDGVADIDIKKLLQFHMSHNGSITMTAIQPEGRFGALDFDESNKVLDFTEKPKGDGGWINGGFFVCDPSVLNEIDNDETIFERLPLQRLVEKQNLYVYKHYGNWKCMDTLRDKIQLNEMWESGHPFWKF